MDTKQTGPRHAGGEQGTTIPSGPRGGLRLTDQEAEPDLDWKAEALHQCRMALVRAKAQAFAAGYLTHFNGQGRSATPEQWGGAMLVAWRQGYDAAAAEVQSESH